MKKTDPVQKICETCAYWDTGQSLVGHEDTTALCRGRAPSTDDRTGKAVWPFTETCDWCGDWKMGEQEK